MGDVAAPSGPGRGGVGARLLSGIGHEFVLLSVATQFLTRLPTPAFRDFRADWLSQSARYFPAVGAIVGGINVGVWWLAGRWLPATVAVGLMLAVSLLVTGAFHEDGFADSCDGFGGGVSADRVLAIMKDSRIGAYGALGIAVMLGLKWTTLLSLPGAAFPLLVVSAHMLSRWCACGLIWALPYVRIEADAKAKPLANTLRGRGWVLSGLLGSLLVAPFAIYCEGLAYAQETRVLVVASLAALLTALGAGAYIRGRIGGYTGDCLGAVQQLSELAFLLAALAALAALAPTRA